jgi:imidazole glycerol-phosphate synthase subunit HisH
MNKANIVIIDYGMGNIQSIHNALVKMGGNVSISNKAEDLQAADALILPGVGAFSEAMSNLKSLGLIESIINAVKDQRKPLLGICLGMQLLADSSDERGSSKGLSLIPGNVKRIPVTPDLRLPHIGWNTLLVKQKEPLFLGVNDEDAVYFVHSYHFVCDPYYVSATTDYGCEVVAAVQRENIFGVQFHPERSQKKGLMLLGKFVDYVNQTYQESEPC